MNLKYMLEVLILLVTEALVYLFILLLLQKILVKTMDYDFVSIHTSKYEK